MRMSRCLRALAGAAVLAMPLSANAAETGGCESFAWPLATEMEWMKAADSQMLASGTKLEAPPERAMTLALQPMKVVAFPVAPTSKPRADAGEAYGGVVNFSAVPAGLYQVTLASAGWIDVVQDSKTLKPTAHTGKSDCDVVRKSVRFDLAAGPFSIELSGISKDSVKFSVRRAE